MATINRYTIQGSIVVDQRPLTPPTPRYQVTITGGYLDDDRTEDIIFYDYADEQIAKYKEALLANMMQFYTKIN